MPTIFEHHHPELLPSQRPSGRPRAVHFQFKNGWVGSIAPEWSPPDTKLLNCACWLGGVEGDVPVTIQGPSYVSDDEAIEWLYQVSQRPKDDIPDTMKCVFCAGKAQGCIKCHGTGVDLNELNTALQDYEDMVSGGKKEGLTKFWHDEVAKEAADVFRVTIHVLATLHAIAEGKGTSPIIPTILFNINDYVWVKLTDLGRAHHKRYWMRYLPTEDKYAAPKEDSEGWSRWQMHDLMAVFGEKLGASSMALPFELEIRFEPKE